MYGLCPSACINLDRRQAQCPSTSRLRLILSDQQAALKYRKHLSYEEQSEIIGMDREFRDTITDKVQASSSDDLLARSVLELAAEYILSKASQTDKKAYFEELKRIYIDNEDEWSPTIRDILATNAIQSNTRRYYTVLCNQ